MGKNRRYQCDPGLLCQQRCAAEAVATAPKSVQNISPWQENSRRSGLKDFVYAALRDADVPEEVVEQVKNHQISSDLIDRLQARGLSTVFDFLKIVTKAWMRTSNCKNCGQ